MTLQLPVAPARPDLDLVIKWIEETSKLLTSHLNEGAEGVKLKPLEKEPRRPRDGLVVMVTPGGAWDPDGTGDGGYFGYYSGNWVKLG